MRRALRCFGVFSPPSKLVNAPGLVALEDYYQAVQRLQEGELEKATQSIKSALAQLELGRKDDYVSYAVAATLLARTYADQSLTSEAEGTLEEIVVRLQPVTEAKELFTRACVNLMIQYLHSNVQQAAIFGRNMLDLSNWSQLHPSCHSDWHFLHGVSRN